MKSFVVSTKRVRAFRTQLLKWYRTHQRDLPWRKTDDPYHILVAEVMLQQTQVERVVPAYQRWLKRFPTVKSLAHASRGEVLREWSGLGYNRRALALHACAQHILRQLNGRFPTSPSELQKLPGIGPYTAHAIAVFAFRKQVPVVDTNIKRVLGRVFLGFRVLARLRKRHNDEPLWELSNRIVEQSRSVYSLNQALMDFGSLVCSAKHPQCKTCPMQSLCASYPDILTADSKMLRVKNVRSEKYYFGQPRRIWRGKILRYLKDRPKHSATLTHIGVNLQADWNQKRLPWLSSVVETLENDGLVKRDAKRVRLPH